MTTQPGAPAHFSIGDVLAQLKDEFPDVTISKIRFLESQGLLVPERTASGYRKFYAADIERLRWILRQQKEFFLPLKVIKERLEEIDRSGGALTDMGVAGNGASGAHAPALFESPAPPPAEVEEPKPAPARSSRARAATTPPAPPVVPASSVADVVTDGDAADDDFAGAPTGISMTRTELARAAELSDDELVQLEEYGLVVPAHRSRDRVLFDDDALEVARIAAQFMRHGVEPRHLRMYRAFADREAALFEQVLLPFRRRRNPAAQERGEATLRELANLGRRLRTGLLRQAVRRSGGL
jgi:DNA-binding transcriptional MerR regulator